MNNQVSEHAATPASRYQVILEALRNNQTLFNDSNRHMTTFLLIGMGWLVAVRLEAAQRR